MKKICISLISVIIVASVILSACGAATATPLAKYLGGEIKDVTMNDESYRLVCVYTEYTNNSGETMLPADEVNIKAFQNGVEIPVIVFTGEKIDEYIQCDTAIQTGTTAKVIWTFQPEDDSPVSLEFSDGQTFLIE
ncbi:MAG: DUF5067 domain-containing protein [Clostridia bacterium]|nr:DUF5067 domain-containing protein [Clostridia bacterium]